MCLSIHLDCFPESHFVRQNAVDPLFVQIRQPLRGWGGIKTEVVISQNLSERAEASSSPHSKAGEADANAAAGEGMGGMGVQSPYTGSQPSGSRVGARARRGRVSDAGGATENAPCLRWRRHRALSHVLVVPAVRHGARRRGDRPAWGGGRRVVAACALRDSFPLPSRTRTRPARRAQCPRTRRLPVRKTRCLLSSPSKLRVYSRALCKLI